MEAFRRRNRRAAETRPASYAMITSWTRSRIRRGPARVSRLAVSISVIASTPLGRPGLRGGEGGRPERGGGDHRGDQEVVGGGGRAAREEDAAAQGEKSGDAQHGEAVPAQDDEAGHEVRPVLAGHTDPEQGGEGDAPQATAAHPPGATRLKNGADGVLDMR
ncbi:hypothetical protein [Streptomyces sp. E-08]|uniref:hypothetical protein n=1 Tax=Streptomyces sp. E-08 TaxID=3404047 RepID=UPI003CEE86B5